MEPARAFESVWYRSRPHAGGYAGMFGGTRRLAEGLSHLAPATFDDAGAGRHQKRLAWLLPGIVPFFISRAFF